LDKAVQDLVDLNILKKFNVGSFEFVRLADAKYLSLVSQKCSEGLTDHQVDDLTSATLEWLFTCVPPLGYETFFFPLDWIVPHCEAALIRLAGRIDSSEQRPTSDALKATIASYNLFKFAAVVHAAPAPDSHLDFEFMAARRMRVKKIIMKIISAKKAGIKETRTYCMKPPSPKFFGLLGRLFCSHINADARDIVDTQHDIVRFHYAYTEAQQPSQTIEAWKGYYATVPAGAIPVEEQQHHVGMLVLNPSTESWDRLLKCILAPEEGYFHDVPQWYRVGFCSVVCYSSPSTAVPSFVKEAIDSLSPEDLKKWPMLEVFPQPLDLLIRSKQAPTLQPEPLKSLVIEASTHPHNNFFLNHNFPLAYLACL
jgi:hypothetical protein